MTGKISRLPRTIRDELNRRLDNGEPGPRLLTWLNSNPEVQTLLAADFAGRPVSKQNLNEWTKRGFRSWKMRQDALEFSAPDDSNPAGSDAATTTQFTDKLVHWLALCLAATAHTLAPTDETTSHGLRQLRDFAADVIALRQGDLHTRRLAIEEKRLSLLDAASREKREKEFWEWIKRPEIAEKLRLQRQKKRDWHDLLRAMVPEVAPFLPDDEDDEAAAAPLESGTPNHPMKRSTPPLSSDTSAPVKLSQT